jgi:hypothetical protein
VISYRHHKGGEGKMGFVEVVFTTKYVNFTIRIYKDKQYSDITVEDVMSNVIKAYNDEKDYIYISPVNGNSVFIKKKFIVGFYVHEDYT